MLVGKSDSKVARIAGNFPDLGVHSFTIPSRVEGPKAGVILMVYGTKTSVSRVMTCGSLDDMEGTRAIKNTRVVEVQRNQAHVAR